MQFTQNLIDIIGTLYVPCYLNICMYNCNTFNSAHPSMLLATVPLVLNFMLAGIYSQSLAPFY